MRYFGGLTMGEIAEVLKIHINTVRRDWSTARDLVTRGTERRRHGCNLSAGRLAPRSSKQSSNGR